MPAVSQAQQHLFGSALAYKRGKHPNASKRVRELADSMDEETLTHFTATNTAKLPEHVADLKKEAFRDPAERLHRIRRRRGEETSIVLVAGIHGDEPAGWSTLKAFKKDPRIATIDVGNHSGKRTQDGEDLNRQFGTEDEPPDVLDTVRDANPSLVIDLHEDTTADGAYAYCSPSIAARVKAIFSAAKGIPKAKVIEGDKAVDGVIYKGRNPKPGTLEIALEAMGTPYCTIETPVTGHTLKERVAFQTEVVNKLLAEFAEPLPAEEPPVEKAAQGSVLHLLHEAKRLSDEGKYSQKAAIIRSLMVMHPEDWEVDDDAGLYVSGITHKPTKYRFHLPKSAIMPGVGMAHAEEGTHEPDLRYNLFDKRELHGVEPEVPIAKAAAAIPTTGPEAISHALSKLDLAHVEESARKVIDRKQVSKRPRAVQLLNILEGFKRNNIEPSDLMIHAVPVIPPVFRPFAVAGDTFIPGDANELYQDLFKHRDVYKRTRQALGDAAAGDSRLTMYDAVKALYGFGDPVSPKQKSRGVKGFLQTVAGSSPKFCYDDATEVLTKEKGWVLFEELPEGVEVGTVNPDTHAFEWQLPSEYTHADYTGYMAKITNGADREGRAPKLDLLVTPNHRMWSSIRTKTNPTTAAGPGKWDITEAAEWVVSPKLRRYIQLSAKDYVEGSAPQLPAGCGFVDTKDFAEFLGWWLSEGDLHTDGTACTIWQSDYNAGYCRQLDELFARLSKQGLSTSKYEKQGDGIARAASHGWAIIGNRALCTWLAGNCGHRAINKRIPRAAQLWDKEHLLLLYRGITRGDGNKRKVRKEGQVLRGRLHKHRAELTDSHHAVTSTSLRLLEDLQELVFKLGIQGRITLDHPARGNQKALWNLSLYGRWFSQTETNTQTSWSWYTGKVHCCTVPNTLLVVRRNKCVAVSGNSVVQRRLLSKTQDSVGRSTVIVDPELSLDQIGLPRDMARTMYANWVQRRLVRMGMSPADALQHLKDKTPYAERALEKEVETRPVLYSRAPSWHKFSFVAGKPKLIDGDAIAVNPLVTTGMNMDFDGDFCINKVFILRDLDNLCYTKENPYKYLTYLFAEGKSSHMFHNMTLPTYNTTTQGVAIIDLEDFPHGELTNRNDNGKNGPIEFYSVPTDVRVLALDERTGKPVWASLSHYSKHPGRMVEIVKLHNGRQIVTDDDPRAIYGIDPAKPDEGFIRCTPTEALARKICVPFSPHAGLASSHLPVLTEVAITDDEACAFRVCKLNRDFGYLLGTLCGDGWWDKKDQNYCELRVDFHGKRSLNLADLKGHNAAAVLRILRSWPAVSDTVYHHVQECKKQAGDDRYGDTIKHTFNFKHSELLAEFLTEHLGGERDEATAGSGNKHLSGFMFQGPLEFREGLLCGLVDTDGTCAVSRAKVKPQLMCAFSSTSLRLVRDVKFLASTLGIHSTISWSKKTTAGNDSWLLSFSTPDCKRTNIFSRLESSWKREAFLSTPVDDECGSAQRNSTIILPRCVADALLEVIPNPKITPAMRALGGAALEEKKSAQNTYMQVWQARKAGVLTRQTAAAILAHLAHNYVRDGAAISQAATLAEQFLVGGRISAKQVQQLRDAIRKVAPHGTPNYKIGQAVYAGLNRSVRSGVIAAPTAVRVAKFLKETKRPEHVIHTPVVAAWLVKVVANETINWSPVVGVQKTGIREDGYDLTVPGYDTFMAADGIILSNTVNLHIPASDEAVREAHERLMPSKMLFTPRDADKVIPLPKQEHILGMHNAKLRPSLKTHFFNTEDEAAAAIDRGDVPLRDEVQIRGQRPDPLQSLHSPKSAV